MPAAGSSISHSGCSQATARSVLPCAVTDHTSSRSPQSAGTPTRNAKLWKRGRNQVGCPWSAPPDSKRLPAPTGTCSSST